MDASTDGLFARAYDPLTAPAERWLGPHRRYLAAGLEGRVLDVGTGTGATLPYLASGPETVVGLEPDPQMRRRAAAVAGALDAPIELVGGVGERLPFRADAFDGAVLALVLCTVADPGRTLDELARVLRPGAELRFLEHVHGEGVYGGVQSLLAPLWRRAAGGCRLDRDTAARLAADERFRTVERERVGPNVPPVAPFVRGRLRRV
jgi:SAM-dependent methyltransferase